MLTLLGGRTWGAGFFRPNPAETDRNFCLGCSILICIAQAAGLSACPSQSMPKTSIPHATYSCSKPWGTGPTTVLVGQGSHTDVLTLKKTSCSRYTMGTSRILLGSQRWVAIRATWRIRLNLMSFTTMPLEQAGFAL